MARERKLKAALDRHKGVDHKLEHQKKVQKQAEKRKRDQTEADVELDFTALEAAVVAAQKRDEAAGVDPAQLEEQELAADAAEELDGEVDGWESDEDEDDEDEDEDDDEAESDEDEELRLSALDDSESESEDEQVPADEAQTAETDDEAEEDIPLSDMESLASEDKADIVPHQRLTINNTAALTRSLKSFALPSTLPFSATQAVTSAEAVQIPDIDDDLNRELSFYKQALDAAREARALLKKEGVPFSRPNDYFAEMVKSEEQMGKVRQKQVDEAARKKASAEARKQRDLKKFGKAVQIAKLQERDKAKRDTMDKINTLKRKRQGADLNTNEEDLFDVALEDAAATEKKDRAGRRGAAKSDGPNGRKRQKKDEKYGFGGKKRFAKSNDAQSAGDTRGYSVRKMKGKGVKPQRPGKNRRARTN